MVVQRAQIHVTGPYNCEYRTAHRLKMARSTRRKPANKRSHKGKSQVQKCKTCNGSGHNRRTCPNVARSADDPDAMDESNDDEDCCTDGATGADPNPPQARQPSRGGVSTTRRSIGRSTQAARSSQQQRGSPPSVVQEYLDALVQTLRETMSLDSRTNGSSIQKVWKSLVGDSWWVVPPHHRGSLEPDRYYLPDVFLWLPTVAFPKEFPQSVLPCPDCQSCANVINDGFNPKVHPLVSSYSLKGTDKRVLRGRGKYMGQMASII